MGEHTWGGSFLVDPKSINAIGQLGIVFLMFSLGLEFSADDMKKTLPVSLSKFVGPYQTNYAQMFAAIVIAIIPTIIVYCIFSNQIVDGLTQGAVKG